MILKNKKMLLITSLLTLLPIPVGLLLWDKFPETMAIHWGITGKPDSFASVPVAVFLIPLSMLLIHWFCVFVTALDKGNKNQNRKLQTIVLWVIPVICNISCCGMYALALGLEFSPVLWTLAPIGILFILLGNYMPKTKMNGTIGVKVPWAYSSQENWHATHRFAGKVFVAGGLLMILGGFLPNGQAVGLMIIVIFILCVLPIVYSWRFYKKEQAAGKDVKAGYSKTDKKVWKGVSVFLVLLTAFVCFMLFCGDIDYIFQEDHLLMDTNMYTDYILPYEKIEDVQFREGNVPGLRVGGFGSFRLLMGFFENQEFGTYMRYTYYNPDACVVVMTDGKTVVFSGKTPEETRSLYDTLLQQIS